ncbi:unnamed protein product [Lepeophtheirus salmonis]|uniref:(salmon louse) hypothetical protein n=1 Tax=Lepeophtheirus salmonis TaxID=72036 RepID=A0A7R8CEM3_LEPSM|nr:unnamed protein product [Lepeophtheirus salmonis]CAF2792500.1 unnamed protein product [Lepeophtheirus salmonis]
MEDSTEMTFQDSCGIYRSISSIFVEIDSLFNNKMALPFRKSLVLILLGLIASTLADTSGPVFIEEPPNHVDFSKHNRRLRQVQTNGNLVLPPFRAQHYSQEVHAQTYRCIAENKLGKVQSRDVHVRAVVNQPYSIYVEMEHVINGNDALFKCKIPSFISDLAAVLSWADSEGNSYSYNEYSAIIQSYETDVSKVYSILGNDALIKCSIPSFVSDFVSVVSWHDSEGNVLGNSFGVIAQDFKSNVDPETYAIIGNDAIFKCDVPSFVTDLVKIVSWHDNMGNTILESSDGHVIGQAFKAHVDEEIYVIIGNDALIQCKIPSFVADTVEIVSWHDNTGNTFDSLGSLVIAQDFQSNVIHETYVIVGNDALVKCDIPSFVADNVHIVSWHDSEGNSFLPSVFEFVISQDFKAHVPLEIYVILGNDALLKCDIPSFVADFVRVISWHDHEGNTLHSHSAFGKSPLAVNQDYKTYVNQAHVIKGNDVLIKCDIPSFVSDIVYVVGWLDQEGQVYSKASLSVVTSQYDIDVFKTNVIKGNDALFKCVVPSFISDFLSVISWVDSEEKTILQQDVHAVNQDYSTEAENEYVINGNDVLINCKIPSFVSDFVKVIGWIDNENNDFTSDHISVVQQYFKSGVEEEYVVIGNDVILKCKIPSFISDFLSVVNWEDSENVKYYPDLKNTVISQNYDAFVNDKHALINNDAFLKCEIPSIVTDLIDVLNHGKYSHPQQDLRIPTQVHSL